MERQAGAQDGSEHHAVAQHIALLHAQRRLNANCVILEFLRNLISHDLAQALDVGAETQALLLQVLVADLAHELSHQRIVFTQIDNVHFLYCLVVE